MATHFVTTIEAEDLHAALGAIAERFQIPGWQAIVDDTREW